MASKRDPRGMTAQVRPEDEIYIVQTYVALGSYSATGRHFDLAHNTVKAVVERNKDLYRKLSASRTRKIARMVSQVETIVDIGSKLVIDEMVQNGDQYDALTLAKVTGIFYDKLLKSRELDLKEESLGIFKQQIDVSKMETVFSHIESMNQNFDASSLIETG